MESDRQSPAQWPQLELTDFVQQVTCPCCGSPAFLPVGGEGKNVIGGRRFPVSSFRFGDELRNARDLHICQQCGVTYQIWTPSHELLLRLYAAPKAMSPWPPDRRRLTWKRALQYLPKQPGRLLDIGANDGHFLSMLPGGWQPAALEPAWASKPKLQAVADEIHEGFIDDRVIGLPPDYFDVVCLFDVVEHFRDVKTAMTNLALCLRPGGLLMLETGNTSCLPAQMQKSLWWYYDYIEHFVFLNPTSLKRALATVNLYIESCMDVVHTNLGIWPLMWWDLVQKSFRAQMWKGRLGIGRDRGYFYLEHPLRVYWPDHMFVVARKATV